MSRTLLLISVGLAAIAGIACLAVHAVAAWISIASGALVLIVALWSLKHDRSHEVMRLEAELAGAQSAFKQVVENLPVGLFMFDGRDFTFTNWAWDEQMMRLPGQTPQEAFKLAVKSEDPEGSVAALKRYAEREEPFAVKMTVSTDFGDLRYVESQGVPVYGAEGEFMHLLGFNVDATRATLSALDLDTKNKALETAYNELERNVEAMVASLVKAIEAKDRYTAGHSERVMEYSVRIGHALGLSKEDMRILRMGTLIHDIGKIGVPDSVLSKPDKLTAEEFDIIKLHPITGFNMVRDIPFFRDCAPIVRWHHERLDGTGYPDGLQGDEISLLVQISTIADMYDAMTSNRAYRRSLGPEVAIAELRKDADRGIVNPELVEIWARLLVEDGILTGTQELPKAA